MQRYPLVDVTVEAALSGLARDENDTFAQTVIGKISEAINSMEKNGVIITVDPAELYKKALAELNSPYSRRSGKHSKRKFEKGDIKKFRFASEADIATRIIDTVISLLKRERHKYWNEVGRSQSYNENDSYERTEEDYSDSDDLTLEVDEYHPESDIGSADEAKDGLPEPCVLAERNEAPLTADPFRLNPEQILDVKTKQSDPPAVEHPGLRLRNRLRAGQLGRNRRKYAKIGLDIVENILRDFDRYVDENGEDGTYQPKTDILAADMQLKPNTISKVWNLLLPEIANLSSVFDDVSLRAHRARHRKLRKRHLRLMRSERKQHLAESRREIEDIGLAPNINCDDKKGSQL